MYVDARRPLTNSSISIVLEQDMNCCNDHNTISLPQSHDRLGLLLAQFLKDCLPLHARGILVWPQIASSLVMMPRLLQATLLAQ